MGYFLTADDAEIKSRKQKILKIMITAKSMIGRPTYYAPNYVNVWFARDNCSHVKFNDGKLPNIERTTESKFQHMEHSMHEIGCVEKSRKRPFASSNYVNSTRDPQSCGVPVNSPRNADSIRVDLDTYLGPKSKLSKSASVKPFNHRRKHKKHEKWAQSMIENTQFGTVQSKGIYLSFNMLQIT